MLPWRMTMGVVWQWRRIELPGAVDAGVLDERQANAFWMRMRSRVWAGLTSLPQLMCTEMLDLSAKS